VPASLRAGHRQAQTVCCVIEPMNSDPNKIHEGIGPSGHPWTGSVGLFPIHERCLLRDRSMSRQKPHSAAAGIATSHRVPLDATTGHFPRASSRPPHARTGSRTPEPRWLQEFSRSSAGMHPDNIVVKFKSLHRPDAGTRRSHTPEPFSLGSPSHLTAAVYRPGHPTNFSGTQWVPKHEDHGNRKLVNLKDTKSHLHGFQRTPYGGFFY